MKVAAYQAPLDATSSIYEILYLIREQIDRCESNGVEILCCPEAVIGGLADYSACITEFAINAETGELGTVLAPLASDSVTSIVGFTEINKTGLLYNSAAIFHKGSVVGIYRKLNPAINTSVYSAGNETPVFRINGLTFGIVICNDSNYGELARIMAAQGSAAIFIPTNNGLPSKRFGPQLIVETKRVDIARATENRIYVVRADVAGTLGELTAYGASEIVGPDGEIIASALQLEPDLIVAEIAINPRSSTAAPP
jgi:predicted amidohydrolase